MSDSLLSWQSAFWSLVPLALNSMLQPTGRIADFSMGQSFLLRSSPMICAIDALSSCFQIAIIMIKTRVSLLRAAAIWNRSRFPASSEHLVTETKSLESSQLLRVIMFIITVAQSIKLLACSGIPYTQTAAYMYILSFAIFTSLQLFATADTQTKDSPGLEETSFAVQNLEFWKSAQDLPILGLVFDVCLLTWASSIAALIIIDFRGNIFELSWWKVALAFFPASIFGIIYAFIGGCIMFTDVARMIFYLIFRIGLEDKKFYMDSYDQLGFDYAGHAFTYTYQFTFLLLAWWLLAVFGEYVMSAKEAEPLSTGSIRTWKSIWRLCKRLVTPYRWHYRKGEHIRDGAKTVSLFLLQVVTCLLWYSRAYKSAGTYKPEWTNKLG